MKLSIESIKPKAKQLIIPSLLAFIITVAYLSIINIINGMGSHLGEQAGFAIIGEFLLWTTLAAVVSYHILDIHISKKKGLKIYILNYIYVGLIMLIINIHIARNLLRDLYSVDIATPPGTEKEIFTRLCSMGIRQTAIIFCSYSIIQVAYKNTKS